MRKYKWLSRFVKRQFSAEEELLLIQGGAAVLAILPFAIWRFSQGQWLAGVLDLGIVLGMLCLGAYGISHGLHRAVGVFFTLIYTCGALLVVALHGQSVLFWTYPAIVAAYFIVRQIEAITISVVSLFGVVLLQASEMPPFSLISYIVTYVLVCVFAYIFSDRVSQERRKLAELATVDPLTGAGNRRALDDEMKRLISSYSRRKMPVSLVILDIDYFKNINDQYGHAVGDQFLKRLTGFLRDTIRQHERLYRFGGEEFVIIAEGDIDDALCLAEQIRGLLEQTQLIDGHTATVSVGVAELGGFETVREWMKRADDALYRAKRGGRNQVCRAEDPADWEIDLDLSLQDDTLPHS